MKSREGYGMDLWVAKRYGESGAWGQRFFCHVGVLALWRLHTGDNLPFWEECRLVEQHFRSRISASVKKLCSVALLAW